MEKVYNNLIETIGNTPLVRLNKFKEKYALSANILAKLEYFNPLGSAKDRAALYMIEDAEKKGFIKDGTVIIEPTSGNTGIGLAFISSIKGYRLILTMPENMSNERKKLLKSLGAELVLTPASEGMSGAIKKAESLHQNIENSFIPDQFNNPANADAHRHTTGPEILRDTDGKVDMLVCGVGTGGTLTGTAEVLKKFNPKLEVIAVEPFDSPVLSGGKAGTHGLQGIGAGFVPGNLNVDIVDRVITIKTKQAYAAARNVALTEGIFVGISSGAALYAATILAKFKENEGKNIVVILPDGGERYMSTDLFA